MIKLAFFDVDGTLTDGKINISDNGEIFKSFDAKDGFALHSILPRAGITPIIITGRESKIVINRAYELGINQIYQGVTDKIEKINEILAVYNVNLNECAFVGDDINDFAAMKRCGFKACPANAINEIRMIADYVSPFNAGFGSVRDICDYLLKQQGKYVEVYKSFGYE